MNLPPQTRQHRMEQIPDPVRMLAYDLPICRAIVEQYANGDIITLEEALCRMIVELASDAESSRTRLVDLMRRSSLPLPGRPLSKMEIAEH